MSSFSIHKAALEGQPGLIRTLLNDDPKLVNAKDEDGRTPLHWAATTSNLSIMQLLLSYHPDLEAKDSMGWTALIIAAASGQIEAIRELLDAGADVNAVNEKGQTALHYAASKGNVPVGKLLVNRGADINAKDRASQQPLHRAATTGNHAFLSLLLNPPEGRPKTRLNGSDRAGEQYTVAPCSNSEGQVPEEIDGVGGQEQKNVRAYVVSKVGPRRD
ncbi:26S proteasome non-ATPase regulatory subunit 10 [Kwoniella heveanensis CBS 569]|nr:26S proteasome non-ATPase regulatory subunit 10 [Kwoniella heveanensis CBS 569]